jgi:hypothetical protein
MAFFWAQQKLTVIFSGGYPEIDLFFWTTVMCSATDQKSRETPSFLLTSAEHLQSALSHRSRSRQLFAHLKGSDMVLVKLKSERSIIK